MGFAAQPTATTVVGLALVCLLAARALAAAAQHQAMSVAEWSVADEMTSPNGPSTSAKAALVVTVNTSQSFGVWEGWGVSLAWWAAAFGDRDDLADVIFSQNIVTLGFSTLLGYSSLLCS